MQLLQSKKVRKHSRWRKRLIILGAAAAAGLAWLGYEPAKERYKIWKQQRALTQAKAFIEKKDAANAQLALEVALRAVPGNPETIRLAADMLEQAGAAQSMRLRRAVVQVMPDSAEDAAKLVLCCLRFRDYNAAKDALSATPPKVAAQPPMLQAALAYALTTDNAPVADYLFQQLKAATPGDENLRHAHALLLLRHPREEQRAKATGDLEELARQDPRLAVQINRELAGAALQRGDMAEAKRRLGLVLASAEATLTDRLQRANLDLLVDKQKFETVFAALAPQVGKTETEAAQFSQWLLVQDRATEAAMWLATLPEPVRQTAPVMRVRADVAAQLKDWDQLENLLKGGAWGPITKETLRLAYAAQTVNVPSKPMLRRDTWDVAVASAAGSLGSLQVLQRLAQAWQWPDEVERTLWTIARTFPDQTWAHQSLFNLYRQKKDSASMRDVMQTLRQAEGSVPRYQHDWALLTLLLEPTASWSPAKETMKQLNESAPTDATYATGYAFALAQAGRGPEALAVVQKLTPAERDYPPRQPYLAFVYGVARQGSDLERAVTAGQGVPYLPEESFLFTRAREELQRKPEKSKAPKGAEAKPAPPAKP